jgi:hypothetical protein
MAERGGQKGNKNASNGRIASQALSVALEHNGEPTEVSSKIKTLVEIWNAQILKAKEGDHQAASMIVDRLEGKAAQSIAIEADISTDLTITRVERIIVEPKA